MTANSISPAQCRMARAGCRITQKALAAYANVSIATLADFEAEKRVPYERTLRDIREALEQRGAMFLEMSNGGRGVGIEEA